MVLKLLGISGSLRKSSTNTGLLRAFATFGSTYGFELTMLDYLDVPMYNQDVEDAGTPEAVVRVREMITQADGIVFACPEYNGYFSSAIKNLIDWGTRKTNVWADKKFVILAAGGNGGGRSGQNHLTELMTNIKAVPVTTNPVNVRIFGRPCPVDNATGDVTDSELVRYIGSVAAEFIESLNKKV